MAKAAAAVPADKLALFEKLVATNPAVELKGAAMPYTSRNGHMFSFLAKTGRLALRLPEASRTAFMNKYKADLCVSHGTIMKEYVDVPDALLKKTRELKKFFDSSFEYVGSLKPKPTTRKKAAGSKKSVQKTKKKKTKKKAAR